MRRLRRRGFTFIELLVVMVVLGLLAAMGIPRIRNMKERSYQATLRSDLGSLRTAQEVYFAEHLRYATDTVGLEFRPSANVTVMIESENPVRGWKASASHAWLATPCSTAVGSEAVGVEHGAIRCANLSVASSSATAK